MKVFLATWLRAARTHSSRFASLMTVALLLGLAGPLLPSVAKPASAAVAANRFAWGQCTWYAFSRRPDLGDAWTGDAWQWIGEAQRVGFPTGKTPVAGAIMVVQPNVGGQTSDPVAVNGGPNGIDLFATGQDGNLYHRWWNSGVWAGWESLRQPAGVSLVGDVSVIVNHPNPIDLFGRGSDGGLYHRYFRVGAWQPWEKLVSSGLAVDPVAASGSGFSTLDVFYPDTGSGTVWDTYYTSSSNTWTTRWVPNGNGVQRKVAVREAPGVIEITVRGGGGEVFSNWFTGGWTGWADRHGQTSGSPTTSTTSGGEIDLFVPGFSGTSLWACNDSAGCTGWTAMCGTISGSDIAAVT